jgi:hypothetical protein
MNCGATFRQRPSHMAGTFKREVQKKLTGLTGAGQNHVVDQLKQKIATLILVNHQLF